MSTLPPELTSAERIHAPERLPDETQQQYRERRKTSKAAARLITGHGLNGGVGSREQYRNDMRKSGTMGKRTRSYVALMAAWASKRIVNWKGLRDEHGAYTLVGLGTIHAESGRKWRRKWLAGISAQRGY